jgi:hypothetical protein
MELLRPARKSIRRGLIVVAGVALFGAGLALADSQVVTMTATGPQPARVTVNWGDTVNFVNADSSAHSLSSTDPEIGTVTVAPSQTLPITFAGKVGARAYVMSGKPKSFYGPAVVVALNGTLDLTASTGVVRYGQSTQLLGHLVLQPGAAVSIQQRPLNRYGNGNGVWTVVAGPFPTLGSGGFSYGTTPSASAEYEAVAAAGQLVSKPVKVGVTPFIAFTAPRRVKAGQVFTIRISVRPAKATRTVDLEAYVPRQKRFHALGHVRLTSAGKGVARVTLQAGRTTLRLAVPSSGMATGFVSGATKAFVVTSS